MSRNRMIAGAVLAALVAVVQVHAEEVQDVSATAKAAAEAYARARWMKALKDRQIEETMLASYCSGTAVNAELCKTLPQATPPPPVAASAASRTAGVGPVVDAPFARVTLLAVIGGEGGLSAVFEVRRNLEPVERLTVTPDSKKPVRLPDGRSVVAIETKPAVCVVFSTPSGRECRE